MSFQAWIHQYRTYRCGKIDVVNCIGLSPDAANKCYSKTSCCRMEGVHSQYINPKTMLHNQTLLWNGLYFGQHKLVANRQGQI